MTTKQDIINDVSRFQRACSAFVQRNVIYCASTLIYELREVAENLDDYDTYLTLTGGRPDYEEAARYFIMQDADLGQLEEIVEQYEYWDDVKDRVGYDAYVETCEEGELEPDDFEDWLKGQDDCHEHKDSFTTAVRKDVWRIVEENQDAFEWVCSEYSLDPDYIEVYEHYIVDRYFGARLHERGEIVEEYLGLLLWGRTCTGQSISMDGVIENMVRDLDDDHWVWREE